MERDEAITRRSEGFEHSDLSPGSLGKFLAGMAVALLIIGGIVTAYYIYLEADRTRQSAPLSPLAGPAQPPLGPALQIRPDRDLTAFHADEDTLLSSYGWVDRKNNIARIPIDQAMGLIVQRGVKAPWGKEGR